MALRILSLNAWGGKLHAPLIPYLVEVNADILCLQEVVRSPETRSESAPTAIAMSSCRSAPISSTRSAQPCLIMTGISARRREASFPMAIVWSIPNSDWRTFVRKSFPVIGQALDFVHGEFSPDGWGEHPRARNAHCLRLFNYEHGFSITIAQMHGLRTTNGKGDTPERQAQADALVQLIGRIWPGNERLVVCGDFNVLPESATFAALGSLGLSDLVTGRGHTDTRTSHYGKSGRYADYMLATPDVDVISFDVVEQPEVSDHRALLLDLR